MNVERIIEIGEIAEQGGWIDCEPPFASLSLKVREQFNTDYVRRQKELYEAASDDDKPNGVLTEAARERHNHFLLAETVLIGWSGMTRTVEAEGGRVSEADLPYSAEEALRLIAHPTSPAFRALVAWAAQNVAALGRRDEERAAKN